MFNCIVNAICFWFCNFEELKFAIFSARKNMFQKKIYLCTPLWNYAIFIVLQALLHCVTKLWVLWKSQRWFQCVCVVLAFDNPLITFVTIWSHHDHIFDSATRTLQQQNQLVKVHANVSKVVLNKFKQYGTEYSSLWWCLRCFSNMNTCKITILMYTSWCVFT